MKTVIAKVKGSKDAVNETKTNIATLSIHDRENNAEEKQLKYEKINNNNLVI